MSSAASATEDCSKLDIKLMAIEAWRLRKFHVQLELFLSRFESIHCWRLGLV